MIAYRVQHACTCVHPYNGHPREDPHEENRAACQTSRRGSPCMSDSCQAERGSRQTRQHPCAGVGEDVLVGVGVRVGPV